MLIWQHTPAGLVLASAVVGDGPGTGERHARLDNGLLFVADTSGEVQAPDGVSGLTRWKAFPGSSSSFNARVTVADGAITVEDFRSTTLVRYALPASATPDRTPQRPLPAHLRPSIRS